MTGRNVTRVELSAAVYGKAKLSRSEASAIVDLVLDEIANTLATGETVKLSSFGSFVARKKKQRIGRNPKTGTEVPISPRRVLVFKASPILKQQMNGKRAGTKKHLAGFFGPGPLRLFSRCPLFEIRSDLEQPRPEVRL